MENTIKRSSRLLSIAMMNLEINKQEKFTAWTSYAAPLWILNVF